MVPIDIAVSEPARQVRHADGPTGQMRSDTPRRWGLLNVFRNPNYFKTLEIAINDFCNLTCTLCSQGTPYQKVKRVIRFDDLERLSRQFRPYEFRTIKISGGEPTIHPDFGRICQALPRLFPSKRYVLATNGALLKKYVQEIRVFDAIELSHYPGHNDAVYEELCRLRLPNVFAMSKHDYVQMIDVFEQRNVGKPNVFEHCGWPRQILKVVQDRMYPCCVVFGLSNLRDNVPAEDVGVKVDAHWRERLGELDIERHCKTCWVNVAVPQTRAQYRERALLGALRKAKALVTDLLT